MQSERNNSSDFDALARLFTEHEAAHFLGVSFRTLQAWRVRGGGPRFCKIGRIVRYRQTDLAAWVESRSRASTSDAVAAA